jgi:predicted RNA-binding Zn-ribbon protein involved in translation (DUF1610 family)
MKAWGKVAAAVGLLLLAGVVYFARLDSFPNDRGSRQAYDSVLMCRACGQSNLDAVRTADKFPLKCEKCSKQEVWPQKQCYQCKHKFVPEPEGNPPHLPMVYKCPKCGSSSVGGAAPDKS